jgi:glyoxylase-like metal-dependent hydrolase (beta-lactamase superfamily II)
VKVRLEHTTTSGTFSLDGESWQVENNVWVVGDDSECVLIDAPHEAKPILDIVDGRTVRAILCTHAHDDHVTVAGQLQHVTGAPIRLHPDDEVLWRQSYPELDYQPLADGDAVKVAGIELQVLHTPGHSPGAVCFYAPSLAMAFTGDTLFQGGPGATGRSYSDFDTIIASIRDRLLVLPPTTTIHTGHGGSTSIGAEAAHLQDWIDRGH